MTAKETDALVKRVKATYPHLVDFMGGWWNEHYDRFSGFAAAVEDYVRLNPESEVRAFLAEARRAARDTALRQLMRRPSQRLALTTTWGGMSLADHQFDELCTYLQRGLDSGLFLSQEEIERRKAQFARADGR